MNNWEINCDEVIDVGANSKEKSNFNEKTQNFYILLAFSLITIALLVAVSVYCYLIKYQAKQLIPFHYINNKTGQQIVFLV